MDPLADRIEKSKLPKLRDLFGYNAAQADSEAELAARRYEYLIEQRDKLNEKIRFGILTLNAASLVALASLVGDEKKMTFLGLTASDVGYAALIFGLGLACAAVAIWSNSNQAISAPARAYEILIKAANKRAHMDQRCGERAEDEFRKLLDEKPIPSPDFAFSKLTIWSTNAAGSIWLGGLVFAISKVIVATTNISFRV